MKATLIAIKDIAPSKTHQLKLKSRGLKIGVINTKADSNYLSLKIDNESQDERKQANLKALNAYFNITNPPFKADIEPTYHEMIEMFIKKVDLGNLKGVIAILEWKDNRFNVKNVWVETDKLDKLENLLPIIEESHTRNLFSEISQIEFQFRESAACSPVRINGIIKAKTLRNQINYTIYQV